MASVFVQTNGMMNFGNFSTVLERLVRNSATNYTSHSSRRSKIPNLTEIKLKSLMEKYERVQLEPSIESMRPKTNVVGLRLSIQSNSMRNRT